MIEKTLICDDFMWVSTSVTKDLLVDLILVSL